MVVGFTSIPGAATRPPCHPHPFEPGLHPLYPAVHPVPPPLPSTPSPPSLLSTYAHYLHSRLLALLLRLSSAANADASEIARRTVEVLDQFERNKDQQTFLLSIFLKLDERSRAHPDDFAELPLTVLSEVCQNGVQTLSSVSGEGMKLCEQAMTTLLQGYVQNEPPSKWKNLFKEATNVRTALSTRTLEHPPASEPCPPPWSPQIGFMVKYMFRESLKLAKEKFAEFADNKTNFKKMPQGGEVQEMMKKLVASALSSYGEVRAWLLFPPPTPTLHLALTTHRPPSPPSLNAPIAFH